ncbi:type VI secretion system protein ImpE [Roseateles sp. YR242]|uniref:type VI secretion system accessory protein TagJ n=1 Tax=Roseateles sp. YR242 TaxID=1855305 RepID=UPI0008D6574B|nr:type VI secretion system accessory protein TagJ [Roseateles sp. YR242]SEL35995.1 type VI secretion system protein ImpE [Roseateles sp. YR242]
MSAVEPLIAAGQASAALAGIQQQVRQQPQDAKLRVLLFQLLAVNGQWARAAAQLEVCGELDAGTLAMVNTYREALKCELVREAVFEGKTTPMVMGEPAEWVAAMVQALKLDADGDHRAAQLMRAQALEQAPASAGTQDGQAFEWICDGDSRLGPILEANINGRYCWVPYSALAKIQIEPPEDLRDLVWAPAYLEFPNGGGSVALIPTRYPRTNAFDDERTWFSRRTEWQPLAGPSDAGESDQFAGIGQRVLMTDQGEAGLLDLRLIELTSA